MDADDGMFWISWGDFGKYFNTVDVCVRTRTAKGDLALDVHEEMGCGGPAYGCCVVRLTLTLTQASTSAPWTCTRRWAAAGPRTGAAWCEPHAIQRSMQKVANRDGGDFGEVAHAAVSRRPPLSLDTMVARTRMYTYDAKVWDSSIVQGPFSVAPCRTLLLRFATFSAVRSKAHCNPSLPQPPYSSMIFDWNHLVCAPPLCRAALASGAAARGPSRGGTRSPAARWRTVPRAQRAQAGCRWAWPSQPRRERREGARRRRRPGEALPRPIFTTGDLGYRGFRGAEG
jgi:hypothetical protein